MAAGMNVFGYSGNAALALKVEHFNDPLAWFG